MSRPTNGIPPRSMGGGRTDRPGLGEGVLTRVVVGRARLEVAGERGSAECRAGSSSGAIVARVDRGRRTARRIRVGPRRRSVSARGGALYSGAVGVRSDRARAQQRGMACTNGSAQRTLTERRDGTTGLRARARSPGSPLVAAARGSPARRHVLRATARVRPAEPATERLSALLHDGIARRDPIQAPHLLKALIRQDANVSRCQLRGGVHMDQGFVNDVCLTPRFNQCVFYEDELSRE